MGILTYNIQLPITYYNTYSYFTKYFTKYNFKHIYNIINCIIVPNDLFFNCRCSISIDIHIHFNLFTSLPLSSLSSCLCTLIVFMCTNTTCDYPYRNKPWLSGDCIWRCTLDAPTLFPNRVTRFGLPPKLAIFSFTHLKAITWSLSPLLPGTILFSVDRNPKKNWNPFKIKILFRQCFRLNLINKIYLPNTPSR